MLLHDVYFTLNDPTDDAKQAMIAASQALLTDHPGTVFFGVGTLEESLNRPVNDLDFHIALHVVFEDKAAHDVYQVSDRHQQFIAENKDRWAQVRVFDSVLS